MTTAESNAEPIVLVGAGLAGCLLATLLGRRGFEVTVYERRPDPRVAGAERGRSINLALSARGLAALERVGLREHALSNALPMPGRMVHPVDGKANFQPYSADGTRAINSISRSGLNEALLVSAEATPGVTIVFDHKLEGIDLDAGRLSFSTPDGVREVAASVVLASDGAYSAARSSMVGLDVSQDHLEQGYKELAIPARDGDFALDPKALHIWARGRSMMIALPNQDKSFTCTLFWPKTGSGSFESLSSPAEIEEHFRRHYPDVVELMPNLIEDYEYNPIGSLVTVTAWPWIASGARCQVALVGDAAHAIVPFFGQGANCAFEDTIEIDELLEKHGADWPKVLSAYQEARKANTDAIAAMALDNFVEMSERVNSRWFRAKSAAVHALERRLPDKYVSRYELVSFSTTPYSRIKARIRRQNAVLIGVIAAVAGIAAIVWRFL
jgi:kynurenine 3-monooxygenase